MILFLRRQYTVRRLSIILVSYRESISGTGNAAAVFPYIMHDRDPERW